MMNKGKVISVETITSFGECITAGTHRLFRRVPRDQMLQNGDTRVKDTLTPINHEKLHQSFRSRSRLALKSTARRQRLGALLGGDVGL